MSLGGAVGFVPHASAVDATAAVSPTLCGWNNTGVVGVMPLAVGRPSPSAVAVVAVSWMSSLLSIAPLVPAMSSHAASAVVTFDVSATCEYPCDIARPPVSRTGYHDDRARD